MILVYCIPFDLLKPHIEESVQILEREGDYPASYIRDGSFDNFTVAIMLDEAARCGGDPITDSLESAWLYNDDNAQVENLRQSLSGESTAHYTRYWHGYLVVLKPLLIFFDVREIRLIFQTVFLILLGAASISLYRACGKKGIALSVALCLSLGLVGCADAAATLPIFFSFAIALAAVCWISAIPLASLEKDRVVDGEKHLGSTGFLLYVGFFVIGAVTVYLDFLDNPLVTLGFPLVVLVLRASSRTDLPRMVAVCCACCAAWLLGYGLLWASKWLLASLVLQEDAIGIALDQAVFRAGISESGKRYGGIADALDRNFLQLGVVRWLLILEAVAVLLSQIALFIFRKRSSRAHTLLTCTTLLILIALLPVGWYSVLANHSAIHAASISYRTQVISLFALASALVMIGAWGIAWIEKRRQRERARDLEEGSEPKGDSVSAIAGRYQAKMRAR